MRTRCGKCGKFMESGSGKMFRGTMVPQMIIEIHDDCEMTSPPEGFQSPWTALTEQESQNFLADRFAYTLKKMESKT